MKNNQPKSNKGLIAVMVLIIVVILILSGVVGYMLFGEQLGLTKLFSHETTAPATGEITTAAVTTAEPTTAEPTWEVPDIVGMKANDAYTALNHAGTRFEIKREYSEDGASFLWRWCISTTSMSNPPPSAAAARRTSASRTFTPTDMLEATSTGATSPTKKHSSGSSDDYILDGSDKRYVSFNEVTPLSEWEITIALNEIYARRGRKFSTPSLQEYFSSKSWYKGTISPSDFNEGSLNQYEAANVQTILAVMSERGYR